VSERESLQFLGRPDVRNAILLGEIGVLIHDVGKVSAEFVRGEAAFNSNLVLRRLTRGKDDLLGADATPRSAVAQALLMTSLRGPERLVADAVCDEITAGRYGDPTGVDGCSDTLDALLSTVRGKLSGHSETAFEGVARLARETCSGLEWQEEGEKAIAAMDPPLFGVDGFLDGLDQLPLVADLLESSGQTWRPAGLLSPEAKLLKAIHGPEETFGSPTARCDPDRLADVRHLWCEVLANQFLEINNIKKDGPGDLGSWFWKSRLIAGEETVTALLGDHDRGTPLNAEERESVVWSGVRAISRWACSKVVFVAGGDRIPTSLWDHCWTLSGLYKSSIAQTLVSGDWPEGDELCWHRLRVGLPAGEVSKLTAIKELIELEYPLGNELFRTAAEASFTFPGLDSYLAISVLDELRMEMGRLLGAKNLPEMHLSPLSTEDAYRLVVGSTP
jgi:hypothetical protein